MAEVRQSLSCFLPEDKWGRRAGEGRLLVPFWENGQHSAIPSILKQKAFVEEQRKRFRDIDNYPCRLSDNLRRLRDDLVARFHADDSGWQSILKTPEKDVSHERP